MTTNSEFLILDLPPVKSATGSYISTISSSSSCWVNIYANIALISFFSYRFRFSFFWVVTRSVGVISVHYTVGSFEGIFFVAGFEGDFYLVV
jgi:hypothetical protein